MYQLYVRAEAQGIGIGRILLDWALDHPAVAFPGPARIGVWSDNRRAQAIYARRDFARMSDYRFPVGKWLDDEFAFRRD